MSPDNEILYVYSIFDIGLLSINFLVVTLTQSEVSTTSKGKGYSCAEYIPKVGKNQVLLRTCDGQNCIYCRLYFGVLQPL